MLSGRYSDQSVGCRLTINTIQYNPLFTQATFRINKSSLKHVRAKKWKQSGLLMTINKREQMTKM